MEIDFYEEFPNQKNLGKLDLVDFPAGIIAASHDLKGFLKLKSKLLKFRNVKEVLYWPVLKKEEGYWFSPFSRREALLRVVKELEGCEDKLSVMWDAELPVLKKGLFFKEFLNFFSNRKIIMNFVKNTKHRIITSEYTAAGIFSDIYLRFMGLKFDVEPIPMYYTSMIKSDGFKRKVLKYIEKKKSKNVGLGCIATGILGNEPLLTPEQLDDDLNSVRELGVEKVVIFRLGGLNKEFVEVIKKYTGKVNYPVLG